MQKHFDIWFAQGTLIHEELTARGYRLVRASEAQPSEAQTDRGAGLREAIIGLLNTLNVYERNWLTSFTGYGKVGEAKKQACAALAASQPAEREEAGE